MNGEWKGTCCFTGHRRMPGGERGEKILALLMKTLRSLARKGVCEFRAGGAIGFDTLAALAVLELKEEFKDVRLVLVLPCRDQEKGWNEQDRAIYREILSRADEVVCLREYYVRGCMHERNRALVNGADVCLAYCTEETGGTAYTVDYANKKGIRVINLAEYLS